MRFALLLFAFVSLALAREPPASEVQLQDGSVSSDLAWSPDFERVYGCDSKGNLCAWSAKSGKLQFSAKCPARLSSPPAVSPDGKFIAAGCQDKAIRLWSDTGKELFVLEGHTLYHPVELAFNADSTRLASAAWSDGTVRIWDPKTGKELHTLNVPGSWKSVVWTPAGDQLLLSGSGVVLVDAHTGTVVRTLPQIATGPAALSPDGGSIATGTWGIQTVEKNGRRVCEYHDELFLWKRADGSKIKTLPGTGQGRSSPDHLQFSHDGRFLGVTRYSRFQVLDVARGKEVRAVEGSPIDFHTSYVFSPDGKAVVSASSDGSIRTWPIP